MPGGNPNQVLPRKECLVPAPLRTPPGDSWMAQPCGSSVESNPVNHQEQLSRLSIRLKAVYQQLGTLGSRGQLVGRLNVWYGCWSDPLYPCTCIFSLLSLHPVLLGHQGRRLALPLPGWVLWMSVWSLQQCLCGLCLWCLPAGDTSLPHCCLDSGIWLSYHILKCPLWELQIGARFSLWSLPFRCVSLLESLII